VAQKKKSDWSFLRKNKDPNAVTPKKKNGGSPRGRKKTQMLSLQPKRKVGVSAPSVRASPTKAENTKDIDMMIEVLSLYQF